MNKRNFIVAILLLAAGTALGFLLGIKFGIEQNANVSVSQNANMTANKTAVNKTTKWPPAIAKSNVSGSGEMMTMNNKICGRYFSYERVKIDGVEIIPRIIELAVAQDKNNCINFENFFYNIGARLQNDGDTKYIKLYDLNSATAKEDQFEVQDEIDYAVEDFYLKDGKIYSIGKFGGPGEGEEKPIGTLK